MEMHSNMLAVYPELLKRVAAIDGVVAAKEVGELTQMIASGNAKRTVAPAVGAVSAVQAQGEAVRWWLHRGW